MSWKNFAAATVVPPSLASAPDQTNPMDRLPRKVLIGTMSHRFAGNREERLEQTRCWVKKIAEEAERKYPGRKLDLILTGECAVCNGPSTGPGTGPGRALEISEIVQELGPLAKTLGSYLAVGAIFWENRADGARLARNGVVLLDRQGELAGFYSKVHLALDWDHPDPQEAESGLIPGSGFPVFDCDFGKVGFLVCYDMSYLDGWRELKENGAEIVAIDTASPQTMRPAMFAHLHQYHVATCTPRNNASIFDPLGYEAAQVEENEAVLVGEFDLSYAILHWSETLHGGQKFVDAYGAENVAFSPCLW